MAGSDDTMGDPTDDNTTRARDGKHQIPDEVHATEDADPVLEANRRAAGESREDDTENQPVALSIEEPDPPWILDVLGDIGIYLGVAAVGLTAIGLVSAVIDLQPVANISLVLALGLVSVALVFGAAYQAYVSDLVP